MPGGNAHRLLNTLHDANHLLSDPGDAGTIRVKKDLQIVELVTAGAETRTLANPTKPGLRLTLRMKTDGGDCVITAANGFNVAGATGATFDAVGELLDMISVSHTTGYRWEVITNTGTVGLA